MKYKILGTAILSTTILLTACSNDESNTHKESKKSEKHSHSKDAKKDKETKSKKKENDDKKADLNKNEDNNKSSDNIHQANEENQQPTVENTNTQGNTEQVQQQPAQNQGTQAQENVKLPKNSEVPEQYIKGDVANALDKKAAIEHQAIEDNEKGLISDEESQRRQEEAGNQFNQAIENQYGPQD